eukprot:CAMPEP_0119101934 /NCGR_PEP_ID=MMETSP1180-20130426/823_1 /TAXON_ID=3052 ORGANISM="Chlamydomonas cf sp, Strain CCMP681" /NCGR_SAMPLE_ID=MMETSP1180 /ASSEMBLY_ACC=CAM_ASM_000741 /LENGTH=699 /DNA_ID=CAMNT_0007086121 /DNA_START=17 /DNA_END=2116 /DNA_ORIENTATION=+
MADEESAPMPESEVVPEQQGAEGAPQQQTEADPEARFKYEEALLIKGKNGSVRRPVEPDEQEKNQKVELLKAEIEKRSNRIKQIKELQESSRSSRDSNQFGNNEIRNKLNTFRNEFQSVLREKEHIREEAQNNSRTREDLRKTLRALRDKLPRGCPDAGSFDLKIRELEFKMAHESGEDEKGNFKRLQELQQARPAVQEAGELEAKLKAIEDARADIQARLAHCDGILNSIKAQENGERAVLDGMRSVQAETELDIPALNVEKKENWDIMQALRTKINEIRDEYSTLRREFVKQNNNWHNYQRFINRQQWQERQKVRAERDAAEAGEDAGASTNGTATDTVVIEAYAAEVFTLEQLLTYLRKLQPADEKAAAAEDKKEVEIPKGFRAMKKEPVDTSYAVAKKKPQASKKPQATVAAPAVLAKAEPAKRKLNHSLETLKTFMQFNMEVPQTSAELGATLDKAEAKKAYYLELRRTGKKHVPEQPRKVEHPQPEAKSRQAAGSSSAALDPLPAEASREAQAAQAVEAAAQAAEAAAKAAEAAAQAAAEAVEAAAHAVKAEAEAAAQAAKAAVEAAAEAKAVATAQAEALAAAEAEALAAAEAEAAKAEAAAAAEAEAAAAAVAETAAAAEAEAAAEAARIKKSAPVPEAPAEPPASSQEEATLAPQEAAPTETAEPDSGLGVSLTVDGLTDAVSLKLRVAA